jgi:adenosine deaminase
MASTIPRGLPVAVLHDHLDGGLRVGTLIELADDCGHRLPASDPTRLAEWFDGAASGSLEDYLDTFAHTVAVMQTPEGLERIAYEAVEDHAADGVVYAEIRFDPGLCTRGSMDRDGVIEAALAGFARAERTTGLRAHLVVTALRHLADSEDAARAAARFAGGGVVGFDIAGPERGHPPDAHLPAIRIARDAGLGITVHAGEGDGPHSIWRALARCGADRIGHGVHIADCTDFDGVAISALDRFAERVRDLRVPLEVAVSSNVDTGNFAAAHPLGALHRAGFNVSINTDNRLMSGVTVSGEYGLAMESFGFTTQDLRDITVRAIEAGFGPWPQRRRLIEDVVVPAYEMAST